MKKNCLIAACAGLAMASAALASPPNGKLQSIPGTRVDPIEIASIRMAGHGQYEITSPWVAYHASNRQTSDESYIFDCYDGNPDGSPTSGIVGSATPFSCGGTAGNRWYFGATYLNPDTVDDMENSAGFNSAVIDGMNITWHWGQGASRPMYVVLFWLEDMINDSCDNIDAVLSSSTGDGLILHYNNSAGAPGYYYSPIDGLVADGFNFLMPSDSDGSYYMILAGAVGSTITLDGVAGTQPMLWGCSNNGGTAGRVGSQLEQSYDDDNPTDGQLTADECYSYDFAGFCPEPMGKCNGFLTLGTCTGNADYNGDGFITGEDFDTFVREFEAGCTLAGDSCPIGCVCGDGSACTCTGNADYNGDGFITGEDFDDYVRDFEAGCM